MQWSRKGNITITIGAPVRIDSRAWSKIKTNELLWFILYGFKDNVQIERKATLESPIIDLSNHELLQKPGKYNYYVKIEREDGRIDIVKKESAFNVVM
jgi:hypothetical protein